MADPPVAEIVPEYSPTEHQNDGGPYRAWGQGEAHNVVLYPEVAVCVRYLQRDRALKWGDIP